MIYRDRLGAICRRWNWKEADRTKVTEQTRDAVIVMEGLPPIGPGDVSAAIEEVANRIRKACGGSTVTARLDASRPSLDLF